MCKYNTLSIDVTKYWVDDSYEDRKCLLNK